MAYLVDIQTQCDTSGRSGRAAVELLDWRNESRGRFCRKCGRRKLNERNRFEKANPGAKHQL